VAVPTTAVVLYPTTAVELGLTSVPMVEPVELGLVSLWVELGLTSVPMMEPVELGLVSLWVELDGLDPLFDEEAPVALGLV
jgi:hypothetical protein